MTANRTKKQRQLPRKTPSLDGTTQFEKLLKKNVLRRYALRLYITGSTPRSARAIANIRAVCEEFLPGQYRLDVVDIYQQPAEAMTGQIVAAPTLVKRLPKPLKRLIGDLSDREKVLAGLELLRLEDSPKV